MIRTDPRISAAPALPAAALEGSPGPRVRGRLEMSRSTGLPPAGVSEVNRWNSSTRPCSRRFRASWPPPSNSTRPTPRAASSCRRWRRLQPWALGGRRRSSTPRRGGRSSTTARSTGWPAAGRQTLRSPGSRPWLSRTTRRAWRWGAVGACQRSVSMGSSTWTVQRPTTMASVARRRAWANCWISGLVTWVLTALRPGGAVRAQGQLEHHPGQAGLDELEEGGVELGAGGPQDAFLDGDAVSLEDGHAASVHPGVGVPDPHHHPADAGPDEGAGAGRGAAVVAAGLEGHVGGGAPGILVPVLRVPQGHDFPMGVPGAGVYSPPQHLPVPDQHAAHGRVGTGQPHPLHPFPQGQGHETFVARQAHRIRERAPAGQFPGQVGGQQPRHPATHPRRLPDRRAPGRPAARPPPRRRWAASGAPGWGPPPRPWRNRPAW